MVQQEPFRNTMYENIEKQTNSAFLNHQPTTFQQEARFQETSNQMYINQSVPIHYNVCSSGIQNNNVYLTHNSNSLNQINTLNIQNANYQPRFNQASNYNYPYDFSSYQTFQANKTFPENQNSANRQMNLIPISVEESDSNSE